MKKLLLFILLVSSTVFNNAQASANTKPDNDKELILKIADNYGTKVVHVSFDGVDDYIGELTIMDKNNRVVQFIEVFEIISYPNYGTINVSEFSSGEYTFVLKTKIRSYSSIITIQ